MTIGPRLIAFAITVVAFAHGYALGADFRSDEPRPPKPAESRPAANFRHYWRFRWAIAACEAGRSFETTMDENSAFDPAIGCSTQANLRAMLSRRSDLVRGRGARYLDAERASNIVGHYRAWKAPGGADQVNHGR
jgi:hypothetical protein